MVEASPFDLDAATAAVTESRRQKAAKQLKLEEDGFTLRSLAGVNDFGFWDPAGFSEGKVSAGRLRFYREVEIKHSRVAMLAAVGFVVAEQWHPLFGGGVDVASYIAFQATPLLQIWPVLLFAISIPEIFSIFHFEEPYDSFSTFAVIPGRPWEIREEHIPGDMGFDPLSLGPEDETEFRLVESLELYYGRWAMIGITGMVSQELATGEKLF